jgi:hypothetical protein
MSTAQTLYDPPSIGVGHYRLLDSVRLDMTDEQLTTLNNRVNRALEHYPELDGTTVTVAKHSDDDYGYAQADWTNNIIFLPTDEVCYYQSICHELSHLAIHQLSEQGEDVPHSSEEFCSIFTTARLSPEELDRMDISYLGVPNVPKDEWPSLCQQALEYRENNRNYIQKAKEWLEI